MKAFFNFRKKVDEIEKATQKRITDDASNYDPVQVLIPGGGSHHPFKAIITHDAGIVHIGFNNQSNNTMKRPAITFDVATRRRFDGVRGVQQLYNASASDGAWKTVPVRCTIRGMAKQLNTGKFEVGATTDTSTEFEVIYLKLFIDEQSRYNN